jgi:hypothetical protein
MLDLIDKFTLPEACAIAEDLIADMAAGFSRLRAA